MAKGTRARTQAAAAPGDGATPTREETARYVASLAAELAEMSRRAELPLLAYFLEMARAEAEEAGRGGPGARRR